MAEDQSAIKIFVEAPSGERFEAKVPPQTPIGTLAADFFESQRWPLSDERGHSERAVVELVNPANPDDTKRLNGEATIASCGIRDGDTLRVFPEAIG